jgi:hypothetical protein
MLFRDQEIDHLLDGDPGCLAQVFMHPHGDVVGGRLTPRPAQVQVFTHDELEYAS